MNILLSSLCNDISENSQIVHVHVWVWVFILPDIHQIGA